MANRSLNCAPSIVQPRLVEALTPGPGPRPLDAPQARTIAPLAGSFQCDLADDSLRWSDTVFDLFGIAPGSKLDRREIVEMYSDESRYVLERLRSHAIAHRSSFTFEAEIRRLDGELRWMRLTADVVCSNGRATHLYGLKQDITAEITGAPISFDRV